MITALGLGSNLGCPEQNIETAINLLLQLGDLVARSHLYKSKPWGVQDQPDFCNAVILLELTLSPRQLLSEVKRIEQFMGRTPTITWGPRLIDIDILTMGDLQMEDADLVIPHPRMSERAFVLVPLAEIDPSYKDKAQVLVESDPAQIWRIDNSV